MGQPLEIFQRSVAVIGLIQHADGPQVAIGSGFAAFPAGGRCKSSVIGHFRHVGISHAASHPPPADEHGRAAMNQFLIGFLLVPGDRGFRTIAIANVADILLSCRQAGFVIEYGFPVFVKDIGAGAPEMAVPVEQTLIDILAVVHRDRGDVHTAVNDCLADGGNILPGLRRIHSDRFQDIGAVMEQQWVTAEGHSVYGIAIAGGGALISRRIVVPVEARVLDKVVERMQEVVDIGAPRHLQRQRCQIRYWDWSLPNRVAPGMNRRADRPS